MTPPMPERQIDRRDLLAYVPAFLVAPQALANAVAPQSVPAPAPAAGGVKPRPAGGKVQGEGVTIPFAMAGCWADDFGARDEIRLLAKLDSKIIVSCDKAPTNDDHSLAILVSAGAVVQSMLMLASASMASATMEHPRALDMAELIQVNISAGTVKKKPHPAAIASAVGIFARPDATTAFDPNWKPDAETLERIRASLIDTNITAVVIPEEAKAGLLKDLQFLASVSPELARSIGPSELWGEGSTVFLLGRGSNAGPQTALMAGRVMQKAILFSFQVAASLDARLLLPGPMEAAAATSPEHGMAAQRIAAMLLGVGFEPLAMLRMGRVLQPMARAIPPVLQMLTPSMDSIPVAK